MRLRVGILGATGIVGQRFVQLLEDHPFFEHYELISSEKALGKTYEEACRYKIGAITENVAHKKVKGLDDKIDCDLVFSAIPSEVAGDIER